MWRCRKISIRGERGEWLMMEEAHSEERPEDAAERVAELLDDQAQRNKGCTVRVTVQTIEVQAVLRPHGDERPVRCEVRGEMVREYTARRV